MSAKDAHKQEKSKKFSDVHSQRHEDKPTQSISSLSSHIGDLRIQQIKIKQQLEDAQNNIDYFRQRIKKYMGFDDQLSKNNVIDAKGELQLWQLTQIKVKARLKIVQDQLREFYESPKKYPNKTHKKKNYALQKGQEPE